MVRSTSRVDVASLSEEAEVLQLFPVEVSRHGNFLTSQYNDFLSMKKVFGNDSCESAKEMIFSVDDDGLIVKTHVK